jgi:hypothetical protein
VLGAALRVALISPARSIASCSCADGSRNYATKSPFGKQNESNTQANSAVQAALQNEMLTSQCELLIFLWTMQLTMQAITFCTARKRTGSFRFLPQRLSGSDSQSNLLQLFCAMPNE